MTVTITDCRAAGYCVRGIRDWFLAHDLDFRDFLLNGISSEVLLNFGDALANNVVSRAKDRDPDG